MKYQLAIFMDKQTDHRDGHDVAPWENLDTLNLAHPDYDAKNVKMLFDAFWPGFKERFDKGEFPADASPTKVFGERKTKKGGKKATSATSSPAPAQKLTYEYSAELPIPAHPFTFGGPATPADPVVAEIVEEESEDDDDDAPYTCGVVKREPLQGAKTNKK
jgi:hypothetical protein